MFCPITSDRAVPMIWGIGVTAPGLALWGAPALWHHPYSGACCRAQELLAQPLAGAGSTPWERPAAGKPHSWLWGLWQRCCLALAPRHSLTQSPCEAARHWVPWLGLAQGPLLQGHPHPRLVHPVWPSSQQPYAADSLPGWAVSAAAPSMPAPGRGLLPPSRSAAHAARLFWTQSQPWPRSQWALSWEPQPQWVFSNYMNFFINFLYN